MLKAEKIQWRLRHSGCILKPLLVRLLKRKVFRWRLSVLVSVSSCSDHGRLFQALGLAHENERSPNFRPRVGPGYPLSAFAPPLSIHFLIFCSFLLPFSLFLFLIHFAYFLLLSIRSLSTRIVPLRFQAWGRRRRPNLGLVCFCVMIVLSVLLS